MAARTCAFFALLCLAVCFSQAHAQDQNLEYYSYYYLSTGAIVGIVIGSLIFLGVVIASIVACCICCVRAATPPPAPVTMHTVAVPQQPAGVTIQSPPHYYAQQPPNMGQQQQFQPAQAAPLPGENPAYAKESSYPY